MTHFKRFLLLGLVLSLALVITLPAQEPRLVPTQPAAPPDPLMLRLRAKLNPEFPPWTPAHVVERCAEHLATINTVDRCRIRYFDLSATPRQLLPAETAALFFGVNSAARATLTRIPQPVPNSDNRLFWIDIGWYNWTADVWDRISSEDPYLQPPVVPSASPGLTYLHTATSTLPVVRADWFLWYVFDNGEFVNSKQNTVFNPESFYYQLVYANVAFERGKKRFQGVGPETAAEFQKAWHVDFEVLKDFPIDRGAALDEGASAVAYHNRVLWRVRTNIGTYWRTFDVFRTAGDQDFIENPFPKEFDAGEHIIQDERGAQFYLLTDGKDKSLDFANPFIVRDPTGPHTALVTARSCISCHDTGILSFRSEHPSLRDAGVKLQAFGPDRAERFNQFFLQERKMQKLIKQDQDNYREFIKDCNGLSSEQNTLQFNQVRNWYGAAVTLEQAAREIGCEPEELADALGLQATKGRLGALAIEKRPYPRHTWERGGFQEAALLLQEWRKTNKPVAAK